MKYNNAPLPKPYKLTKKQKAAIQAAIAELQKSTMFETKLLSISRQKIDQCKS